MAERRLLHKSKVEEFVSWAEAKGWVRDPIPPRATFQVLRLKKPGHKMAVYYRRSFAPEHVVATEGAAVSLVRAWLRERCSGRWA